MNDIIKQLNNTIYFEKVANKPLGNQNDLIAMLSAAFNYSQDNARQFINALNYYAFYSHTIDNAQNISFDYKAGYAVVGQRSGDPVYRLGRGIDVSLYKVIHICSPVKFICT